MSDQPHPGPPPPHPNLPPPQYPYTHHDYPQYQIPPHLPPPSHPFRPPHLNQNLQNQIPLPHSRWPHQLRQDSILPPMNPTLPPMRFNPPPPGPHHQSLHSVSNTETSAGAAETAQVDDGGWGEDGPLIQARKKRQEGKRSEGRHNSQGSNTRSRRQSSARSQRSGLSQPVVSPPSEDKRDDDRDCNKPDPALPLTVVSPTSTGGGWSQENALAKWAREVAPVAPPDFSVPIPNNTEGPDGADRNGHEVDLPARPNSTRPPLPPQIAYVSEEEDEVTPDPTPIVTPEKHNNPYRQGLPPRVRTPGILAVEVAPASGPVPLPENEETGQPRGRGWSSRHGFISGGDPQRSVHSPSQSHFSHTRSHLWERQRGPAGEGAWWKKDPHPAWSGIFADRRLNVKFPVTLTVETLKQALTLHFAKYGTLRLVMAQDTNGDSAEKGVVVFKERESLQHCLNDPERFQCRYPSQIPASGSTVLDIEIQHTPAHIFNRTVYIKLDGPRCDSRSRSASPRRSSERRDSTAGERDQASTLPEVVEIWAIPSIGRSTGRMSWWAHVRPAFLPASSLISNAERSTGKTPILLEAIGLGRRVPEKSIVPKICDYLTEIVDIIPPTHPKQGWLVTVDGPKEARRLMNELSKIAGVTTRWASERDGLSHEHPASDSPHCLPVSSEQLPSPQGHGNLGIMAEDPVPAELSKRPEVKIEPESTTGAPLSNAEPAFHNWPQVNLTPPANAVLSSDYPYLTRVIAPTYRGRLLKPEIIKGEIKYIDESAVFVGRLVKEQETDATLLKRFSKYGRVCGIEYNPQNVSNTYATGRVLYGDPESAARAIEFENGQTSFGSGLKVEPRKVLPADVQMKELYIDDLGRPVSPSMASQYSPPTEHIPLSWRSGTVPLPPIPGAVIPRASMYAGLSPPPPPPPPAMPPQTALFPAMRPDGTPIMPSFQAHPGQPMDTKPIPGYMGYIPVHHFPIPPYGMPFQVPNPNPTPPDSPRLAPVKPTDIPSPLPEGHRDPLRPPQGSHLLSQTDPPNHAPRILGHKMEGGVFKVIFDPDDLKRYQQEHGLEPTDDNSAIVADHRASHHQCSLDTLSGHHSASSNTTTARKDRLPGHMQRRWSVSEMTRPLDPLDLAKGQIGMQSRQPGRPRSQSGASVGLSANSRGGAQSYLSSEDEKRTSDSGVQTQAPEPTANKGATTITSPPSRSSNMSNVPAPPTPAVKDRASLPKDNQASQSSKAGDIGSLHATDTTASTYLTTAKEPRIEATKDGENSASSSIPMGGNGRNHINTIRQYLNHPPLPPPDARPLPPQDYPFADPRVMRHHQRNSSRRYGGGEGQRRWQDRGVEGNRQWPDRSGGQRWSHDGEPRGSGSETGPGGAWQSDARSPLGTQSASGRQSDQGLRPGQERPARPFMPFPPGSSSIVTDWAAES